MRTIARVRSACRSLFRSAQLERDLDEELQCAEDELTARHVARGLSRERAAAERGEDPRVERRCTAGS